MDEIVLLIGYEGLERVVKLLNFQITEESNIINDISDCYNLMMEYYISKKNSNLLEHINEQSIENAIINKKNHDANVFLINRRIECARAKIAKFDAPDNNLKIGRIE